MVPSPRHLGLVALFARTPGLVAALLHRVGVTLPPFDAVAAAGNDLGQPGLSERRVDLALRFTRAGATVAAALVEVQLGRDPDKRFTWPAYWINLRDQLRCEVHLLVVTLDRGLAAWCRRPIESPQFRFAPLVIGPDEIAAVTAPAEIALSPELAVLSAMVHGRGDPALVRSVLNGLQALDASIRSHYIALVLSVFGGGARRTKEADVNELIPLSGLRPDLEPTMSDWRFQAWLDKGLTRAEAMKATLDELFELVWKQLERPAIVARARAEAILELLADRGLAVPEVVRSELLACADVERLRRLQRRALTVRSADELLPRRRAKQATK